MAAAALAVQRPGAARASFSDDVQQLRAPGAAAAYDDKLTRAPAVAASVMQATTGRLSA